MPTSSPSTSAAPPQAPARVVAVIVAYNRRDLLGEALEAIAAQSRPADAVLVVDNASADDSAVVAAERGAAVLELSRNTGGAGGFAVGIAHAVSAMEADLVWLMDDDTIPSRTALEELLLARESYPGPVAMLGSRVVWTDGRDHPMNTPRIRPGATTQQLAAARSAGAVPVRSLSFVSMLVDARAVRYAGLPVADYFIWNDDFEFSCRILRHGTGLFVPSSVVEHRTKAFGSTDADPGERFYYEVRNKMWMFLRSDALSPQEKVLYGGATMRRWTLAMARSADRGLLRRVATRGMRDAFLRGPRESADTLAGLGVATEEVESLQAGHRRSGGIRTAQGRGGERTAHKGAHPRRSGL